MINTINPPILPTCRIAQSYTEAIKLPTIIQLSDNLYIAAFKIMKLLPAKYMVLNAIRKNHIHTDTIITESSSGTFALGLGLICSELKLKFKIFSDPAIDDNLLTMLITLGGSVDILTSPSKDGTFQQARLNALKEFLKSSPSAYWLQQYDNLDNQRAYQEVGQQLFKLFNSNVNVVATVGSGGSSCGIIKSLRQFSPNSQLIGVDTFASVLFGQTCGPRSLRGLGNSILPKNLDHTCFDDIHWVNAESANWYTRYLYRKHAIFMGPTTGAAFQVANWYAKCHPEKNFCFIGADEGYRYISSVYGQRVTNDMNNYENATPSLVTSPQDIRSSWTYYKWNRQSLNSVIQEVTS
jgi:cysteine synthase